MSAWEAIAPSRSGEATVILLSPNLGAATQSLREDCAVQCIVCGEDKAPEIHFDVPVICSDCARRQLQRMTETIDEKVSLEFDAPNESG